MRAYWYTNDASDQRLPHDSRQEVSLDELLQIGVLYYHIPSEKEVNELALQRQYQNRDIISVSPENMGDSYEEKVRSFFKEHLHEDEEIRYILDGAGYFDVRSKTDNWIRIRLEKNDLIILPAGIYHRFTTDESNHIMAMRLFKEYPKWTPLNRGPDVDNNPIRQHYLQAVTT